MLVPVLNNTAADDVPPAVGRRRPLMLPPVTLPVALTKPAVRKLPP